MHTRDVAWTESESKYSDGDSISRGLTQRHSTPRSWARFPSVLCSSRNVFLLWSKRLSLHLSICLPLCLSICAESSLSFRVCLHACMHGLCLFLSCFLSPLVSFQSRAESGRRGTLGGSSLHPMISVQPSNAEMASRTSNEMQYHASSGSGLPALSSSGALSLNGTAMSAAGGGGGDGSGLGGGLSPASTNVELGSGTSRAGGDGRLKSSRLTTMGTAAGGGGGGGADRLRSGTGAAGASSKGMLPGTSGIGSGGSGGGGGGGPGVQSLSSNLSASSAGGGAGESASLQNFFQGLLAKSKEEDLGKGKRQTERSCPRKDSLFFLVKTVGCLVSLERWRRTWRLRASRFLRLCGMYVDTGGCRTACTCIEGEQTCRV